MGGTVATVRRSLKAHGALKGPFEQSVGGLKASFALLLEFGSGLKPGSKLA